MKNKNPVGFTSGTVLIVFGVILIFFGFSNFDQIVGLTILMIYGVIVLGIGIYILLHLDKEDEIEQIKTNKKTGNRK